MATIRHRLVSIVVPVYNEAAGLRSFHASLLAILATANNFNFDILYCDDGSTDDSFTILTELAKEDERVKVLRLTRNFGKEMATTAGLRAAQGDAVITIDADGQHPVEAIPEFLENWQAGSKVVIGQYRSGSHSSLTKKIGSRLYYHLITRFGGYHVEPRNTDFRLIDREVQQQFARLTEHNRITRGLIDWLGYQSTYIALSLKAREQGDAVYSFGKLVKLAVDSIIASSLRPLYFAAIVGAFILPVAFMLGFVMVGDALIGDPLQWHAKGTAYVSVALLFLVGLLMVSQGIIGLYLAHIYSETQNRPLYVIDHETSIRLDHEA